MSEDDEQQHKTPQEFRQFILDLLLSEPVRKKLARAVVEDSRMFAAALKIAAGDEQEAIPTILQRFDIELMMRIAAMTDDARLRYAETGELEPYGVPDTGGAGFRADRPAAKRTAPICIEAIAQRIPPEPEEK